MVWVYGNRTGKDGRARTWLFRTIVLSTSEGPHRFPEPPSPDQIPLAVSRTSAGVSKFQLSARIQVIGQFGNKQRKAPSKLRGIITRPLTLCNAADRSDSFPASLTIGFGESERPVAILTVISGARLFNVRRNPFGRCMQERGTVEHKCTAFVGARETFNRRDVF
jgi:hypothetical protein